MWIWKANERGKDCRWYLGEWRYELGQPICSFWNALNHWIWDVSRLLRLNFPEGSLQHRSRNQGRGQVWRCRFGGGRSHENVPIALPTTGYMMSQLLDFKTLFSVWTEDMSLTGGSSHWVKCSGNTKADLPRKTKDSFVGQLWYSDSPTALVKWLTNNWTFCWLYCSIQGSHPNFLLPSLCFFSPWLRIKFASGADLSPSLLWLSPFSLAQPFHTSHKIFPHLMLS